jgi:hypothetical protein
VNCLSELSNAVRSLLEAAEGAAVARPAPVLARVSSPFRFSLSYRRDVVALRLPLCFVCGLVSRSVVCGHCVNAAGYAAWRTKDFAMGAGKSEADAQTTAEAVIRRARFVSRRS